ncbi:M1 family metallopeptidase, partial [Streptomyces sparsus]
MVTLRNGAALRRTATATAVAVTSLALVAAGTPAPEPLGIGDRLFPHLGNPGYDVRSYDISLRYTGDNTDDLEARTRIEARATGGTMDTLNLDFSGGRVRSVQVDGSPATSAAAGEDIVVTPSTPVEAGSTFTVDIRHTSPTAGAKPTGWIRTADGLVLANQADAAHRVFPGNDHPSDKALFTFRVTVPRGYTAVTSGRPLTRTSRGADRTWSYRTAQPMATELAQVSIGRSDVVRRDGPRGLPMRDVVPSRHRDSLEPWLARTPRQMEWMEKQVGDYPFETYGVLAAEADFNFALETQTLSLFSRGFFTDPGYPDWYRESIMMHELAHHWFGNSVSPRRWSDLWLNEGHATWYEWRFAEERGGFALRQRVKAAYQASDTWRRAYGPPAALKVPHSDDRISIFQPIVYDGSAVVLYALRQKIGAADFDRLQREWVERHRDGVAGTGDFVALANEVSGQDLTGFLRSWLYGRTTPPMPGHPDWKSGADSAGAADPHGPAGGT